MQESYPSSSPIWFVESDDPNLTSVLERLEDIKSNTLVRSPFFSFLYSGGGLRFISQKDSVLNGVQLGELTPSDPAKKPFAK